jgi:hypothetical protein
MKAPFVIGRLRFGGFFLYNGINHLRNRRQMRAEITWGCAFSHKPA